MSMCLFFIVLFINSNVEAANSGIVAYVNDSSDLIVVQTNYDMYTCGEIYTGGYYLQKGDRIVGRMDMFGLQTWYSKNGEVLVYVDEFWLNSDEVFEWLRHH